MARMSAKYGTYPRACQCGFICPLVQTHGSPDIVPVHWAHFGHIHTFIGIALPRLREGGGESDTITTYSRA